MNPRTCVGCRAATSRAKLVRLAWDAGAGTVVLDEKAVLPGRGAWIHPRDACVTAALRKRGVPRALRRPVDAAELETLLRDRCVRVG